MTPKNECEILLDALLPFAQMQLKKHGEFYPYSAVLLMDGTVQFVAANEGDDRPESQALIDLLIQAHKKMAQNGEIKASGIAWNAATKREDGKNQDSIVVSLEHQDGYSVIVGEPYKIGLFKKVNFGELFAIAGKHDIF